MADLSIIKSKSLREELSASRRFQLMSEEEQSEQIKRIASLPAAQQRKFIKFFKEENAFEEEKYKRPENEQQKLLAEFLEDLEALKTKFTKLALQDKEQFSKTKEGQDEKKLLEDLNNL